MTARKEATFSTDQSGWRMRSKVIVGTPVKRVTFSRWMSSSALPASHLLIMATLEPMTIEKRPMGQRAVMWNSGTAMSCTPLGSGAIFVESSPTFMAVPTLRCVCTTPFGKPVEPEVYMIMASSSAFTGCQRDFGPCGLALRRSAPAARTSSHASAPVARADSPVTGPRTTMVLKPIFAWKFAQSARRSGSPMTTLHSASPTAYSSSSLFQSALSGTATPPMAVAATKEMSSSG
mmetsp:Transcript_41688/g.129741  ORF Transcript_41688/g.129741 Transcript_41688/m.129741 type:complete len:234 (+) Transcript_41688:96-797(+)